MPQNTEQLAASLESLTLHSFEAFCEDIVSMFGNAAECTAERAGQSALIDLKKDFNKLASVNLVQAEGTLNGTFQLLLDQAGLFVLAGVFVMLPEKRIHETIRNGTLNDANYINDAIKEVGNLIAGSWDRIFREELVGHKHFKQTGTFIGSIWDDTDKSVGFDANRSCRYVICKMKVDDFPEFKCAAVFSESLLDPGTDTPPPPNSEPAENAEPQSEPVPAPTSSEAEPQAETMPADAAIEPQPDAPEQQEVSVDSDESASGEEESAQVSSCEPTSTEQHPGPVAATIRQMAQQTGGPSIRPDTVVSAVGMPVLSVEQIMNPAVLWVDPEDTVEDVLRRMQQHNVGYVLVGRDGQLEGLVSRSDIAAAVSPYTRSVFAHWRRPLDDATLQIRIKWFMSRPVHTIRPEASLIALMEKMMRRSVRGLPVVDVNGQTLGFVTVYDIFDVLLGSAGVCFTGRPQQAPPPVQ